MIEANNPGNIRYSSHTSWQGLSDPPFVDHGKGPFCVFTDPVYGLRAMMIIIAGYPAKHGVGTIDQLIDVWAPPSDSNPVDNYKTYISRETNIGIDELICLTDAAVLIPIVKAMCEFENGPPAVKYTMDLYEQAAEMALS